MDRHLDSAPSPDEHLADLVAKYADRQLQPGEFTVKMWRERAGVEHGVAQRQINDAIKAGDVKQVDDVKTTDTKRRCKAFRKV